MDVAAVEAVIRALYVLAAALLLAGLGQVAFALAMIAGMRA